MTLLHIAILIPFLSVPLIPLLYKYTHRVHTGWFVMVIPLVLFIFFASYFSFEQPLEPFIHSVPWIPSLNIHFSIYLDSLSLLFALLITGIGALVVFYSIFYMSKDREKLHLFYAYLMLFMGAMLGSVLSDNLLVLYAFWELTSVSSFLLIAFWYHRKRSRYGAQKSMFITMSGGFSMLLGFIILYVASGTFSIRELIALGDQVSQHSLFILAMFLILLGAFTKSAQFPFHIWLPDAMEAPTPISAYLHSATMVKAGVYLVARLTPVFGGHYEWFWTITIIGLITLLIGSLMAIRQSDLKALLAFSTISQIGLIMCLLGIGSMALNDPNSSSSLLFAGATLAAIFHLINHSIFKGCLFMMIGILDHETGTRDIRRLGGLIHVMPVSFTLTMIGAFSMAGLPPFSGFLSKEMFFSGVLTTSRTMDSWLVFIPIIAWVASIFTFIYCMILIFKVFIGPYKPIPLERKPHEAPLGMLISPMILAALVVILFFFPNVIASSLLEPAVQAILPQAFANGEEWHVHISAWHGFNTELLMTFGVVILGTLLYKYLNTFRNIYENIPLRFSLNQVYDNGLAGMERIAGKITKFYMTGSTTHYLSYLFAFLIVIVGGSLFFQNIFILDISNNAPIEPYEFMLGLTVAAAAIFMIFTKSRLISIIAVSVIGFIVSLFFVIFRAPDLALTQLVVETISTALFLLCFYFLPKVSKYVTTMKFRISNAIISIGVGLTLTLIGLLTQGHHLFDPISEYYKNSYNLAGAKNMVNSILVDFRAFDTMLEIVVLFAAGVGIFTLIKLRHAGRKDQ
ncbi:Na+/H+ antiporter subunit A [Paenibacillus eucommiae]|uniref:Multicomponent Na+:H+ antiporter subunit A n=1 Tax=Paenibacillus eucommiae TaxID=1355755 RepID=A0ABS4JAS6_9BACL|nr:Na+/H+ antiporter subunit A [Paenibacillus eucommiae]MBP1996954.1 multicomponent Na+:H+ antiporter subunit A [Paenibacillus eucommiae]